MVLGLARFPKEPSSILPRLRRYGKNAHMNTSRPVAIDLFAGVGGMSLGFEQAGFDVVGAVEYDPVHACAHHFNFPQGSVLPRSVSDVSASDIRALPTVGDRKIDLVFGGAPCQGFSLIGQRAIDDPRNSLVRDFLRIVVDLDADYFVFENVKGLTVGQHKKFLEELVEEFRNSSYSVRLPWRVLNADSFGVPQSRERLFLLGAKNGLQPPDYPEATHLSPRMKHSDDLGFLPIGPSVTDALSDLPNADDFPVLLGADCTQISPPAPQAGYAMEMRCLTRNSWHLGYQRIWQEDVLTSSARTKHSAISARRFASTAQGDTEPISRFFKLPADGVSNTLRAGSDSARGAFTSPRPIHYNYPRCITVREMARLHGFPDWFRFNHTKWHGARQIGNAVPPPLARHVASTVVAAMGRAVRSPRKKIELGDTDLLYKDMGGASRYWGIEAPIGGRDRKSGAKKRTQEEIERTLSSSIV